MEVIDLNLPQDAERFAALRVGQQVRLYGSFLTGRDAAHQRLCALLDAGQPLPVVLEGETIYYVGPCPPPPGFAVGACGPTTSGRMDAYTPRLMAAGLKGMIGKGPRSGAVREAVMRHGGVYFAALGGGGALLAQAVTAAEVIAFEDLGTEAIHRFTVEAFPALVVMDAAGGDLYRSGPQAFYT